MTETSKNRMIFWSRLISWLAIGCGVPIGTFAYKFGLFKNTITIYDELGNVVVQGNLSLNGWGIISCILIGSFIMNVIKEVADANTGYSLTKQCYMGIVQAMPLIIAFAVTYFLKGVVDEVMFCLAVLILCKLISTPINPLPKWKYDKLGKEDYSTVVNALTDFVKSHLKGGGS